jgi:predicted N-acetyltransferase YhbS
MCQTVHIVTFENKYAVYFKEFNLVWLKQYFSVEDIDRKVLDNPEEQVIKLGGMIFFALHGAEAVGTIAMLKHGNGVYELSKLAVRDDMQQQGIGKILIRAALEWVKTQNGEYVFLVVV